MDSTKIRTVSTPDCPRVLLGDVEQHKPIIEEAEA